MDESGKKWGRKDRRIETLDGEDAGEWWRHKKNNEHIGGKYDDMRSSWYVPFISVICIVC